MKSYGKGRLIVPLGCRLLELPDVVLTVQVIEKVIHKCHQLAVVDNPVLILICKQ